MVAKNFPEERLGLDDEVVELSLLVPSWQVGALEEVAQTEGITVAQLLRRLVNRALTDATLHEPGYYYG